MMVTKSAATIVLYARANAGWTRPAATCPNGPHPSTARRRRCTSRPSRPTRSRGRPHRRAERVAELVAGAIEIRVTASTAQIVIPNHATTPEPVVEEQIEEQQDETAQAGEDPCRSDSSPSVGLTVCTDCLVSSTGSAPAFSCVARSFASCSAKPPVISPIPGDGADCTVGDEITTRSTTIAICSSVPARRRPPWWLREPVGAVAVQLGHGPVRRAELTLLITADALSKSSP